MDEVYVPRYVIPLQLQIIQDITTMIRDSRLARFTLVHRLVIDMMTDTLHLCSVLHIYLHI